MATINERMASLETNVSSIQETIHEDVKKPLVKIWTKLDELPCAVHNEKFKSLVTRINWLYFAFVVVVLGGIVLGVWMKYT